MINNPFEESFPEEKKCYKVSEITHLIKNILETEFKDIIIEGEISNFRPSSTGHYYFSLKDNEAIISVVLFKSRIPYLSFKPADGMLVRAKGNLSVYPKRGNYQLICEALTQAGTGNILAMLEERKKKLAKEGLFDSDKKKPLPLLPSKVAVITSPTGAALRDILMILKRRHSGINLVILPAPVQGADAAPVIASQIKIANIHNMCDVIIIGRGGGSLEDLLPFYDEAVVRSIAESKIPVISAVGHETDITLSDLAADVRAPTPSAAAEIVSATSDELVTRIEELVSKMKQSLNGRIENIKLLLSQFKPENLERSFRLYIQPFLLRFDDAKESIILAIQIRLTNYHHKLEILHNKISLSSPFEILKKGYAVITHAKSGKIIVSQQHVAIDEDVRIKLLKGGLKAKVKEKYEDEKF